MRRPKDQLALTAVAVVLGLLVVAQIRGQQTEAGMAGLSAQELTLLIANVNTRNEQLRTEVASLEKQLTDIGAAKTRGESAVDALRADLAKVRSWAGLVAVTGPGVTISVRGAIGGDGVQEVINELWNAGAEAVAVDAVRIVPGVVVAGAPGAVSVDDTPLADGFTISAIGSPQILTGSLTRIGGVIAQLGAPYPDATLTVTPVDRVAVPATDRDLVPADARPRL
jgi:uncharacterized protein YlxW (UPF0749 family)